MLDSFSVQAVRIIEDAKKISKEMNSLLTGSEHLLIAMYNMRDSICHFLLTELNIKKEDILNALSKIEIIHKQEKKNSTFTKKFEEIIINAKSVAISSNSDYVYDEHLFYSLLELKDSVGYEILEMLNVDTLELLDDIEEIFNFFDEDNKKDNKPYSFLRIIKKENFHHPYIKRKDYIEQIIYILNKKQKNNPLLIGNAGVGKTAIIEGLVNHLESELIYELDLGSIVSGTKYRGELEEKIIKAMEFLENKKAVVFIDEIHNIVGAGSNDGSFDIANILKPYLSKSNIRFIGATTLDEYYKYINKDKALSRRFQNIYIDEPNKEETFQILKKIKNHYEEYHNIKYPERILKLIVDKCYLYIPNRSFPDKAIDVLDEVGAIYNIKKTKIEKIIDQVIFSINGIKPAKINTKKEKKIHYKELIPFYKRFINQQSRINNIVSIEVEKTFNFDNLKEDLAFLFKIKEENILELDLENYQDSSSLSNIIGSSKGYVGFEQGGILYEHILKYPFSVIRIKNIDKAHQIVQNHFYKILKIPFVIDNKGRKIFFSNTMFIIDKNKVNASSIGFCNNKIKASNTKCDIKIS